MYILYISEMNKIVHLGIHDDPGKLYVNALNPCTADEKFKPLIFKWLDLVKVNLSDIKKREMDYSFMYTPYIEGCYSIKDLTLYIKKV
uniref:Uncharacterized protein n=1 Tax=viral metagenome TaxID=1070528 RepID=A0A6C0ILJ9_9ZZZZ